MRIWIGSKIMQDKEVISTRAGAIVIHNDCLLLMHRIKGAKEYYVLPGGTVEADEDIQFAAIREVREETSIVAKPRHLLYHLQVISNEMPSCCKEEYYFLCDYVQGSPQLESGAIERQRISKNNSYQPMWVSLDQIKDLLIYPLEIRDLLVDALKNNKMLNLDTKKIKVMRSELRDI